MKLFICHNCSNINSPAGEACILRASEELKDRIISGKTGCLKKYKRGTGKLIEEFEREHGSLPLIVPDELGVETDFYLVQSEEAECNYKKVRNSPLWEVESWVWEYTEEDRRTEQKYKEQCDKVAHAALKNKVANARAAAINYCKYAKPCTIDTDPLRAGWTR